MSSSPALTPSFNLLFGEFFLGLELRWGPASTTAATTNRNTRNNVRSFAIALNSSTVEALESGDVRVANLGGFCSRFRWVRVGVHHQTESFKCRVSFRGTICLAIRLKLRPTEGATYADFEVKIPKPKLIRWGLCMTMATDGTGAPQVVLEQNLDFCHDGSRGWDYISVSRRQNLISPLQPKTPLKTECWSHCWQTLSGTGFP